MKIRSNFVSNSSSASYILDTVDINYAASYMLDVILKDWESWSSRVKKSDRERSSRLQTNLMNIANNQDIKDGKIGVTMPSTNYDTYLLVKGNRVYISTCNNNTFEFDNSVYHGGGADEGDEPHRIIQAAKFYNIENGLIHFYPRWTYENDGDKDVFCKKCKRVPFSIVETLDGMMLCSECYKSLGKSPEKEFEELKEERRKFMNAFKHLEP